MLQMVSWSTSLTRFRVQEFLEVKGGNDLREMIISQSVAQKEANLTSRESLLVIFIAEGTS